VSAAAEKISGMSLPNYIACQMSHSILFVLARSARDLWCIGMRKLDGVQAEMGYP